MRLCPSAGKITTGVRNTGQGENSTNFPFIFPQTSHLAIFALEANLHVADKNLYAIRFFLTITRDFGIFRTKPAIERKPLAKLPPESFLVGQLGAKGLRSKKLPLGAFLLRFESPVIKDVQDKI